MTATLKNKNYKRSQKGRSMVEMLGVLAIVGVLSVGGVYGYGVAMKKHKANELLHQASMLAATISSQILTNKPINVQDFGDSKYGTFGTPTQVNDEQFEMKITGMDEAVCTQVAKMSGGMVRKAECNGTTLTLTYNNNLSSDKVAADYNGKQDECVASGRKYCSGSSSCVALDKECGCSGTNNGCQKCDTETGSFITDDEKEGENCTTADGKEGTCNAGVCAVRNCWATGDCTENDADGIFEDWCIPPDVSTIGLYPTELCKGLSGDLDAYRECRANNEEPLICIFTAYYGDYGYDLGNIDLDWYRNCTQEGRTFTCCNCIRESGMDEEGCKNMGPGFC